MRRKKSEVTKQPHSALIESLSHEGRGIARIDGKATFIQGALPGETVQFYYTRKKKDFDEGQVISIDAPSTLRAKPRCDHYDVCGACSLQHLNEHAQIAVKQDLLLDSLERIGHVQPDNILPPLISEAWNYRNKARLSVRFVEKKQSALVGFREKHNSRYIAEIAACAILHKQVDEHILTLRELINAFDAPHVIAQIEVAAGDQQVALIFRNLETLSDADADKLRLFAQQTDFIVYLQPAGPDSVKLFYPLENVDLSYALPNENLTFKFHPTDFTQINAKLNREMVAHAMALMDATQDDIILDLFCGLGNFSLPLAKRCQHVIGIEGSTAMVERASMNAELNEIHNVEFHCANLDDPTSLSKILKQKVTKLLLDPPRTGALEIVKQIHYLNPQRIVYVSCNPATLARDSGILVNEHGYRMVSAGVMDMFPHTAHVESIALFVKG